MPDDRSIDHSPDGARIRYARPAHGVANLILSRPEAHNAQDKALLYELDAAYMRAMDDDEVHVVVVSADGPTFSSGHDLRERFDITPGDRLGPWCGFSKPGAEGWLATEREVFVGLCQRWRELPKPTIAQVHGAVVAAGLMLIWPCDLIVAADDATFSDPVVALGCNGHEYFVHPWELGIRKAKELLFTGEAITADEAHRLGMVNHVVARGELADFTLRLAERIARRPSMGLKLAKMSVNQAADLQGMRSAVDAAHHLHQLGHSHNQQLFGRLIDPTGVRLIRAGE